MTKHSQTAFQRAMEIAGVDDPSACYFVDDSASNIVAAKRMGWKTAAVGPVRGASEEEQRQARDCEGADHVIQTVHEMTSIWPELFEPGKEEDDDDKDEGEGEDEDGDWWQIAHGSGVGSPPLMVLLTTADRMQEFRTGGYEGNLVKGSSWSVGVLPSPLDDTQLAAVTNAGAETGRVWEERCSALQAAGNLDAEVSGTASTTRKEALRALRGLHEVLSSVGVSAMDLQQAAALT